MLAVCRLQVRVCCLFGFFVERFDMDLFERQLQVRWSDLDPNFHLRHSVYYDWGAFCRVEFLNEYGLTPGVMQRLQFGPILFREECIFRKEIRSGDEVQINLQVMKARLRRHKWLVMFRK